MMHFTPLRFNKLICYYTDVSLNNDLIVLEYPLDSNPVNATRFLLVEVQDL